MLASQPEDVKARYEQRHPQQTLEFFGIVVQHKARNDMPDDWGDGNAGYLKEQFVIDRRAAAGFEFVSSSDINENPADQPEDIVGGCPRPS